MRLASLNVGRPALRMRDGRTYSTAIDRQPVTGSVRLGVDGLVGDRVSDTRVHGGPDKAACCYPMEHYLEWSRRHALDLSVPAFGENFTTLGLLESEVCIGDAFRIGQATVQVTQPRQPCWKLANKHANPSLIAWMNAYHWTGFYVRVVEAGEIATDDPIRLLDRPHAHLTIVRLNQIRSDTAVDAGLLHELAELPALSNSWRRHMADRLIPESQRTERD